MNSHPLILGLHRVGRPPFNAKIRGLFTTPGLLSFQIRLLKFCGYRFVTLSDSISATGQKNAVITFDDGYVDNLTLALPLLKKHNVPATLFVVTSDIGKKNVVWPEAGEDLPADILSWESLAELKANGWEIGSHSHEHVHLARYEESQQAKLIELSINAIEKNLGERPVSFAYPYGSYDERTKRSLERLGIQFAVTTNPTTAENVSTSGDSLELSRLPLGGRHFYHYFRTGFRTLKALGSLKVTKVILEESVQRLTPETVGTRVKGAQTHWTA